MIGYLALAVLLVAMAAAAWVRLAPLDAEAWNLPPDTATPGERAGPRSFLVIRNAGPDPDATLAALDAIALATPRTERGAGSPAEGRITYVTRSRLMSYPDYTTAMILPRRDGPPLLSVEARARYGQRDMGINRVRVEGWLARLGPGRALTAQPLTVRLRCRMHLT